MKIKSMNMAFLVLTSGAALNRIEALSVSSPTTKVKVSVQRELPALSTPTEARKEFLDYVWENGGGLPIIIIPKVTREGDDLLETTLRRRQLLPILMEEELLLPEKSAQSIIADDTSTCQLQYQVKDGGLLTSEIVPDSHLGTVTFAKPREDGEITLTWNVTFYTTEASRTFIWQKVTEQTITDSCNNFKAARGVVPRIYRRTTMLASPTVTPERAMEKWLQFIWKEGAGFPLPIPPIQDGKNTRWIVPPFLKERLLSPTTSNGNNEAEIQYQVDNPSLFTYQVHSHRGRVRFVPVIDDGTVRMEWEIEIRPYHGLWAVVVEYFTGAVVSCYARNFKCHIQEGPDAMVDLKAPVDNGIASSTLLLQIRKDSWIGGVLDAKQKDQRSTVEQTLLFLQPWTWGRSVEYDGDGEEELWSDGFLSD